MVAASFIATTVEMADLPVTPAGSAGAEQTIQQEIPSVVGELLTNEANDRLLERAVRAAHNDVLAVEGGTLVANRPSDRCGSIWSQTSTRCWTRLWPTRSWPFWAP